MPPQEPLQPPVNKKNYTLVLLLIVSLVIAIAAATLFAFQNPNFKNLLRSRTAPTGQTVNAPLSLNSPQLRSYGVFYTYAVTLKKVEKVPNGLKLTTNLNVPNAPEIIVNESTGVFYVVSGGLKRTSQNNLKEGQKIILNLSYNQTTNKWITRTVTIVLDKLQELSSPSATIGPN